MPNDAQEPAPLEPAEQSGNLLEVLLLEDEAEPKPLEKCKCNAKAQLMLPHFLRGLLGLFLRSSILAIVLALVWSFAEGMRTYGISPLQLPFSTLGQFQPRIASSQSNSPLITAFDHFLFFYNCAFPGATRLGSGVGIIAGAFWTLHRMPHACIARRGYVGAIAGAVIGFRSMMMVSSSAPVVLGATLLGALFIPLYMILADRKDRIPELPTVKMS